MLVAPVSGPKSLGTKLNCEIQAAKQQDKVYKWHGTIPPITCHLQKVLHFILFYFILRF
jgi:hypothetical protein